MKKAKSKKLELTFTEKDLAKWYKSKSIHAKAKKTIRTKAKCTAEHFKKDKWDLDYSLLTGDLMVELLGYNPEFQYLYEISRILKRPVYLKTTKNGLFLSLKSSKK